MKGLQLIADAGSTSCEWRLIDKGVVSSLPTTRGFNPTYEPSENLLRELNMFAEFSEISPEVEKIYYYGAGCSASWAQHKVSSALAGQFQNATIEVLSDLWGAARAVYKGTPVICGILGTGSNACYYDGRELYSATPSLGFVLGDEGSGNHIGRALLRDYFYKVMPENLREHFATAYDLELSKVLEAIHRGEGPSGYLAQFSRFAGEHVRTAYMQTILAEVFSSFITTHVHAYHNYKELPLGLVGSIALHFQEAIQSAAGKSGVHLDCVLQRPIDELAFYHLTNH